MTLCLPTPGGGKLYSRYLLLFVVIFNWNKKSNECGSKVQMKTELAFDVTFTAELSRISVKYA